MLFYSLIDTSLQPETVLMTFHQGICVLRMSFGEVNQFSHNFFFYGSAIVES